MNLNPMEYQNCYIQMQKLLIVKVVVRLSVCGTDCSACPLHGNLCTGCNEACGKVFHANGKACPIYACCANKRRITNCASCNKLPCDIWQATRDPSMTDEQFRKSIEDRVAAVKSCS